MHHQLSEIALVAVFDSVMVVCIYRSWNEWVELPVRICDIPRDAELRFQISDSLGPRGLNQIGSAQISLFGKNGLLREGIYDLQVRIFPLLCEMYSLRLTLNL